MKAVTYRLSVRRSSPGNSPYRKKCLPWKKSVGRQWKSHGEGPAVPSSSQEPRNTWRQDRRASRASGWTGCSCTAGGVTSSGSRPGPAEPCKIFKLHGELCFAFFFFFLNGRPNAKDYNVFLTRGKSQRGWCHLMSLARWETYLAGHFLTEAVSLLFH